MAEDDIFTWHQACEIIIQNIRIRLSYASDNLLK